MSFNQLIKNKNRLQLRFLEETIGENKDIFFNAYTLTDRLLIEQEVKNIENKESFLKSKITEAKKLREVDIDQLNCIESYMQHLHKKNLSYEDELLKSFKEKINHIESKKIESKAKISELLQKMNHLSGFSEGYKFVVKENFENLYNINKSLIEKKKLNADPEAKVCTLPIKRKTIRKVQNLIISNDSNGVPGNYLSGGNKMIYSIVDDNPNTYFEFFKLNEGPVKLVLNARFSKKDVTNHIEIKRSFTSGASTFVIKDVIFNDLGNKTLKSLVGEKSKEFQASASSNGTVSIYHLPVECSSISVILESSEYTTTAKGLKLFSIGIEKIIFSKIEYENEGEFSSSRIVTPEGLYGMSASSEVFPEKSLSYEEVLSVSSNNGAKREKLDFFENKTKDLLLTQNQNFINYIYSLKRNDNLSIDLNNLLEEKLFVKTNSYLTAINRKVSPVNYFLKSEGINNSLKVVQPNAFNRSEEKEKAIKIGTISNTGINKIEIPFSLKSFKIEEEDIILFGNNFELEQIELDVDEDPEDVLIADTSYCINYEDNSIIIMLSADKKMTVKMLLKPNICEVILKNEGYYIEVKESFEYDKKSISIYCTITDNTEYESIIPKGSKRYFFPKGNLSQVTLERETENGWILEEESNNTYKVKSKKAGIISLYDKENQYRVKYKRNKVKKIDESGFEIWAKDGQIKGLYVYPEEVSFNDNTSSINENVKKHLVENQNIIKGSLKFKAQPVNRPYKEVEFIDGYSEFLNIKKMKKDFVPKIEWFENEIIFTLEKTPYLEGSYLNSIKLYNKFGEELNSELLNASNTESNVIYKLNRPEEDTSEYSEGYYLEYYYLGETLDEIYKYSVNYKDGIIYFSEVTETKSIISYKYGNLKAEYNIYHEIKNFKFDKKTKTVLVNTEEFSSGNNRIKFLWHELENESSIEGLEKYYSPIVYSLKLGMN